MTIKRSDKIKDLQKKGEVSVRLMNVCCAAEIETVEQLMAADRTELLKFRNCGKKTIWERDELIAEVIKAERKQPIEKAATKFAESNFMYCREQDACYEGFIEGYNQVTRAVIEVLRATGYFESEEGFSEEVIKDQFMQCVDAKFMEE